MSFRMVQTAAFIPLGLVALVSHAGAQEGPEAADEETSSQVGGGPAPAATTRPFYLLLTSGLGYASLSEDRPNSMGSSSASEVSASGLAIQVYGGATGCRPASRSAGRCRVIRAVNLGDEARSASDAGIRDPNF